jgi:hypothetical protein
MNQTKHCWQNYVDYHKCILAKGEDFAPCRQFWLAYRSLCPSGWYQRWDEQRGMTSPAPVFASAHADNFFKRPETSLRAWNKEYGRLEKSTTIDRAFPQNGGSGCSTRRCSLGRNAQIQTLTMLILHL